MKGAVGVGSVVERAQLALNAGCDMLIICNDFPAIDELMENLNFIDTVERADRVKRLSPMGSALSWSELEKSSLYQSAKKLI